ncbi:MAG: hypothetical protein JSV19_12030 [Phycisphaerales bacterium]|nr:MAG: hypothetical protein JSV19_12030 [Phycisphaerales bacterium]
MGDRTAAALVLALGLAAGMPALAETETPLASYEPSEVDLTVTANHPSDPGLTVTIVEGGVGGAPAGTDGDYVLMVDFVGETDGKIEFRHDWSASTYDLAGEDELLADVYIATASAIPGIMGIWSANWTPPDAWQPATGLPTTVGVWTTISFDVSTRSQTGLDYIHAFIFENMPGADGTAYVDNLRLSHPGTAPAPTGLTAIGYETRIDLDWEPVSAPGLDGYNIYRAESGNGPYARLNSSVHVPSDYSDDIGEGGWTYFYYVTSVVDGEESAPSDIVFASTGISDEALLTTVQQATFSYFWDFAHPVSGLTREGLTHWSEIVTTGGSGMGLMAIVVGAERGFVTRSAAADRVLQMLTFLDENATRYHGAWSHWLNGSTGATIPFSTKDDGGDLVETSYLVQGLLTVRQYFDAGDPVETEIRTRATQMWESVEWDWYRRYPNSEVLYWHWSPNYGWDMNMTVTGYNEAMITYLLAIASPTHPMPGSSYYNGWAGSGAYANGNTYYGFLQWVGPAYGGPLFFTHYSFLGFDPRYKSDAYCNYFENSRNISLIHQAYCIDNPNNFAGYGPLVWGLTASTDPWGYLAHSPTNDNGTITPSAALGAMPFAPAESIAAMRHFIYVYANDLWGPYGFYDAFNLEESWFSDTYLAIDQGPIIIMIENYRTQLCWDLFMANPEIKPMLQNIGWTFGDPDLDGDGDVDLGDYTLFADCMAGPNVGVVPPGCADAQFHNADLDGDEDVDLGDFASFQRVLDVP